MLYLEIACIVVISVVFGLLLWQHGLHIDAAQLTLKGVNFTGVRLGVVLAMFSSAGFESATTLGEEVKDPLRTIPRSIIQSTLLTGLFFITASYVEVLGLPVLGGPAGPERLAAHGARRRSSASGRWAGSSTSASW
jgi:amino acid transporter